MFRTGCITMKPLYAALACAVLAAACPRGMAEEEQKLAVVNVSLVFEKYNKVADVQRKIDNDTKDKKDELSKRAEDLSKRNKEVALAVLKKYTRNDDREVLEHNYDDIASRYLAMPIPTLEGIRTILTELSSTTPGAKNADPEQFVSYRIAREIEASGFVKRLYEK